MLISNKCDRKELMILARGNHKPRTSTCQLFPIIGQLLALVLLVSSLSFASASADADPVTTVNCGGGGTFNIVNNIVTESSANCSGSVTIPSGVTSFGTGAFWGRAITSVSLPNTVTDIGHSAFRQTSMTAVTIPSSVQTIGYLAFGTTYLTEITFASPSSLTTIGDYAFQSSQFTSITIPASVTSISSTAFELNTRLTNINFLGTIPSGAPWSADPEVTITQICSPTSTSYTSAGTNYSVLTFESVGTCQWTVPNGVTAVDLLLIGGGGGGGGFAFGGGGGGGGFSEVGSFSVTPSNGVTITVGDGGSGGYALRPSVYDNTQGSNGAATVFGTLSVLGGGGGGGYEPGEWSPRVLSKGASGASGGGASENGTTGGSVSQTTLANNAAVFGNTGGDNYVSENSGSCSGAGGGGAGGVGQTVTRRNCSDILLGGAGKSSTLRTNSAVTYSAGGAGGHMALGEGGYSLASANANTGNGGDGASYIGEGGLAGAKGASGLVVVRYSTAPNAALNPTFGAPTRTANGFTVSITNYDSAYTWATPTVSAGSVAVTSTDGANRLLTVTGLSPGASATITQTTTRTGYSAGSNTVSGTALGSALTPTFGTVTRTADGFTVPITNYDSDYTWATPTVSAGSVAITSTDGANRLLTVTGLSSGASATITQATSRTGYSDGSNTVSANAITGAALNPTFGAPTRTANGFTVSITNYDSAYTWATPTVSAGSVAITSTDGANRLLTVTGLSSGASATITQATSRTGYSDGSNTVSSTALSAALNPTFGAPIRTANGFTVSITNYDSAYSWATPSVSAGSVAVTSGVNWSTRSNASGSRSWSSIASSSDGTKLAAVTYGGSIYTSSDSGTNWTVHSTGASRAWRSIASSSDGVNLAAVYSGGSTFYRSSDSGANWRSYSTPVSFYTIASSANGTKLVAAPTRGYLYTSTNSGGAWTPRLSAGLRIWKSVASSSDGANLAAVDLGGYIYTSNNSGATWTARATDESRQWISIASSSDGTNLVAVVAGGYIYTSNNSGADWIARATDESRQWISIASSSDGTKLIAGVDGGYLYTSTDSGVTWVEQTSSGELTWQSVASNSDGTKLTAAAYGGYIYTSEPDFLTVTGLSANTPATITQTTSRSGYVDGSNTVSETALAASLTPTFGAANRTIDGFTLQISNYSASYGWSGTNSESGSVFISESGLITVTDLAGDTASTVTITTTRDGYVSGSATSDSVTSLTAISTANVTITAPVTGATPVTSLSSNGQYTTAISWSGSPTTFASNTIYTATVTVTPISGYTLTGVAAGLFTINSEAPTTANLINAGSFTKTFPVTATTISTANVAITAPVTGDTPVASLSSNGQFTTAITWSPVRATFAANTVYTATVTVTPVAGYTLTGVTANFFTVNGNAATSANSANAGVFTFTFPETAIIITEPNVTITAPVTGATPVTSLSSNGQYTTAISWSGSPTTFASNTIYTATVTVTPISGYTLTGVAAGLFTINSGAPTTANLINTGSFTKTFPVTATTISTAAIAITAPATGATPVASTTSTQYNTTITWSSTPSRFNATTAYTATITITPNAGYTLAGVTANFFTVTGATVTNLANSATVTAVFGATGAKLPQTITFAQPAGMSRISANQSLTPTTSATGGYSVTLTVNSSSSICQLSGNAVEQKALGTCSITASQAGDGIYAAATSITRTFTISKATQNITFTQPSAMVRSSENQILVASSSGGAGYVITLATTTPTYCDIVAGKVRVIKWPGTCSISASNAGDLIYAAGSTSRSFTISKDPQTITFTQPTTMSLSSSNQNLVATSSASLTPIVFTPNTATCAITDSNKVRVVSAGTCTITASQAGNDNYAASTATRSFTITKKTQTITFTQPNNMARTSANQSLSATSTSGLAITFSSLTPFSCSVVNGMIKVNGAGPCTIAADQSGNTTWAAAPMVGRTILITRS